ncbi:uncharacterized protein B0H64DRAFT_376689 [Chaetomium fimeti]|uniref:Uncharacterized protein n=1 Tax=Chaetomium fimeti TaxID=1854472 RepID=A0AAE0H8U9_9PEZI|nr:hypothetical protein B0H64DRAFT_376689 [Chaetomium fimeti]
MADGFLEAAIARRALVSLLTRTQHRKWVKDESALSIPAGITDTAASSPPPPAPSAPPSPLALQARQHHSEGESGGVSGGVGRHGPRSSWSEGGERDSGVSGGVGRYCPWPGKDGGRWGLGGVTGSAGRAGLVGAFMPLGREGSELSAVKWEMPSRAARMARLLRKDQRELRMLPRCVFVDTGDDSVRVPLGFGWSGWGSEVDVLSDDEVLGDEVFIDDLRREELLREEPLGGESLGEGVLGEEPLRDEPLGDELLREELF